MSRIASSAAQRARAVLLEGAALERQVELLAEEAGINVSSGCGKRVLSHNIASDLVDKNAAIQYPAIYIYCESLENKLREKFRTFSGGANMVAEVRVSQDRLDGLDLVLHVHVDAVLSVLNASRGDWGLGMFYTGGYEVTYGPVRQGGRNFIQTAKIAFAIEISTD